MKAVLNFSFFLAFFSFSLLVRSSNTEIYVALDPTSKVGIVQTDNLVWKPYQIGETIQFGYNKNATVWCKMVLDLKGISKDTYWVFDNIHLDSILVYHNDKLYAILGDRTQHHSRFIHTQAIGLGRLPTQGKVLLLASVKKQWTHLDFSMNLVEGATLHQQSNLRLALTFSQLGFATLLLILSFYIYFQTKRKLYLFYILYSGMGLIYVSVNLGLLRAFLFPEFIYFSELRIYSSCYWFLLLGLFLSETLQLKEYHPGLYRTFHLLQTMVFGFSIYCLFCLRLGWDKALSYSTKGIFFLFFINIILITLGLVKGIRQRNRLSIYVLFSFIPHLFWGLSMILFLFKWIEFPIKIEWINWIVLYEIVFFGWVLIKDYVEAFRKNKLLQEKIIQDEKQAILTIEKARLKERRQVSELLHDKIGIDIARAIHTLEMGQDEKAKSYLFELGKDIRNLSHTILPKELEEGALWSAISSQVSIFRSQFRSIQVSIGTYDFPPHIEKEMAQSLYLMIIELIQNSLKHAQPKTIRIEFFGYPDLLVFTISDDGKGFFPIEKLGFGLQNIERRVKEFGGNFELTSEPEEGTTVLLSIPRINTHP